MNGGGGRSTELTSSKKMRRRWKTRKVQIPETTTNLYTSPPPRKRMELFLSSHPRLAPSDPIPTSPLGSDSVTAASLSSCQSFDTFRSPPATHSPPFPTYTNSFSERLAPADAISRGPPTAAYRRALSTPRLPHRGGISGCRGLRLRGG